MTDYEQELTTAGGQAVTATAAGTKYYDEKGVADVGVGGAMVAGVTRISQDFNNCTSLDIAIQACDDASGTNAVTLVTKNVPLAQLTMSRGPFNVGVLPAGTRKRYLRAYFTVNGAAPGQGKVRVWLADKGSLTENAVIGV